MKTTTRRGTLLVGSVVAIALLAGCTSSPETPTASPGTEGPPVASQAPDPVDPGPQPDPTCETILTPTLLAGFADLGWTAQRDPFVLGDTEIDGMMCKWADFEEPNSNEVQIYGWGRIDQDQAAAAQILLEDQGWQREDTGDGVLVTEDPAFAMIVDDAGYGMTYLFGDGWVIVADTRQNLVLINRPE